MLHTEYFYGVLTIGVRYFTKYFELTELSVGHNRYFHVRFCSCTTLLGLTF